MESSAQEMSLKQWCDKLPASHRVNEEIRTILGAITILELMMVASELHSELSEKMVKNALDILR